MTYLLIGVLLAFGVWAALRWYANADPALIKRGLAGFALIFLLSVVLLLVFTGRFSAALPFAFGAYLAYSRLRQGWGLLKFLGRLWGATTQQPRNTSSIETDYLAMTLNKASGELEGRILKGAYAGQALGALTQSELMDKYAELRRLDRRSAQLMETYLDRVVGSDWRQASGQAGFAGDGNASSSDQPMTPAQAAEVLGVMRNAAKQDILDAHRRLMKVAHPDQGGSSYLAQQINVAKDVLLKAQKEGRS
ncbi:MAG: hypothetical protein ACFBZ9_10710 [Sphingomonadales bacterium]